MVVLIPCSNGKGEVRKGLWSLGMKKGMSRVNLIHEVSVQLSCWFPRTKNVKTEKGGVGGGKKRWKDIPGLRRTQRSFSQLSQKGGVKGEELFPANSLQTTRKTKSPPMRGGPQ